MIYCTFRCMINMSLSLPIQHGRIQLQTVLPKIIALLLSFLVLSFSLRMSALAPEMVMFMGGGGTQTSMDCRSTHGNPCNAALIIRSKY